MEKMTAMASVSSTWIPEDDLLLKNSIEAGASLEALARGAVNFSRRFTFRELRDRWHSLLYDPDVSAQASARMAELELSGSNPSSKSSILKGNEKSSEKRKLGSVRRHYYAMRKRIKNDYFNSQNLGFFEEHNNLHNFSQQEHNVTNDHGDHGGDAMIEDCLANNLGFEEKDFEILRQAFPESIGGIATTTTTATIAVDNPVKASHMEACHKSIKNDFINGSFDQNVEMKNATCINESGPTETPNENLPKTDKSSGFGGKHLFNSPVSDGSASFHAMGFSSPSTRLPLWKTLEDVSAPDMPVDENKAEPLAHSNDCDHIMEGKSSQLYGVPHMEEGQPQGEYTDLPDSLLNFSNEDAILFMDVDSKDSMHDDIPNTQEADLASPEELKEDTDMASTSVSQLESLHLTEGQIICTLNKEDPDIPCNDDIFLLIHPSTLPVATDSGGPLSSSSHEKDVEQGLLSERKGKDLAPCFTRSNAVGSNALTEFVSPRSLVGSAFKRESLDSNYLDPLPGKPNHHRTPSQTRSMHTGLEITGNGLSEEDASKVELRGFNSPAMYSEMLLPLQVGSVKMIDPESIDDSDIDDQNNFDSDGDIPYFSDVEAMVLEMDLAHSQESRITSEVARYQNEEAKRMIIRLEQAARSSFQRAMSSHGALAIFYGRRLKQYIKKTEVTIGRSTDDTEVDIDLRKEGRANKISRRQAIIKMETDGSFSLKNLGSSSISLNGKVVAHGQLVALSSSCLIEIRGMNFVFEINKKYVRRFLDKQPR